MDIEIFEYEYDRPNRRMIVRGSVKRDDGSELLVTGTVPADDTTPILNALNNGNTVKKSVTDILSVRVVKTAAGEAFFAVSYR